MYQATRITEVKDFIRSRADAAQGFVPTMGALHEGHLELIRRARRENDLLSCSIFVNPIQFNNREDLEKYPRSLDSDLEMLETEGCDLVFTPSEDEMYPEQAVEKFDFGDLETVMEGKYRPGHFNGVALVVKRLLDILTPQRAYFGEKDYQQLRVIQELVKRYGIPVEIIPCPTVREADGLAMSSRNRRLNLEERSIAPLIFNVLKEVNEKAGKMSVGELKKLAIQQLSGSGFIVDYFEIAAAESLQPLNDWKEASNARAFVACYLGNVRLIDNMELFY
jgi:pantoate--beta-alanine ligase